MIVTPPLFLGLEGVGRDCHPQSNFEYERCRVIKYEVIWRSQACSDSAWWRCDDLWSPLLAVTGVVVVVDLMLTLMLMTRLLLISLASP